MEHRIKKVSRRDCLRCNKPFDSEGTHNRVCFSCNRLNTKYLHREPKYKSARIMHDKSDVEKNLE